MAELPSAGGSFYRVVHRPRVAVRAEPSVKAAIVYALAAGEVFHVEAELASGWVKVAADEAWVHQIQEGYVLIDGAELGLGRLLERLPDEEVDADTWPYSRALRRAVHFSVPFAMEAKHMRPLDARRLAGKWLSAWHEPDSPEPVRWVQEAARPDLAPRGMPRGMPRLCVALLVRGVGPAPLASFVRYHHAIGFERVAVFFDAPEDGAEAPAIEAAGRLQDEARGRGREVSVHLCTPQWWERQQRSSRFYARRVLEAPVYRELVELHERVRDVQARQCLAMEVAIREAQRDGFDWLLHVDSDEALLMPEHRDARDFFAAVELGNEQVVFHNLEAVPEQGEVDDWFREVSLFKVHSALLQADPAEKEDRSAAAVRRRERLEKRRRRRMQRGLEADDVVDNRAFDHVMFATRMARRDAALAFRFDIPPVEDSAEETSDGEESSSASGGKKLAWARDVPCYYTAYSNGKAAVRLPRDGPPPLPVGVHRCASDANAALRTLKCAGPGAPVVLHYANCGLGAWKRKYRILAQGHGTEDGGFSVTRKARLLCTVGVGSIDSVSTWFHRPPEGDPKRGIREKGHFQVT